MKKFLVIGAIALASSPALAGNLLTNGSFESGFSGWSQTFSGGSAPVAIQYGNAGAYPVGAFGEAIGPNNVSSLSPDATGNLVAYFSSDTAGPDTISQSIFLVAGTTYDVGLDFYFPANGLANPYGLNAVFSLGGNVLTSGGASAGQTWYNYGTSYTALVTGLQTLTFQFYGLGPTSRNFAADMAIDRVYVNSPAVPEPATWAMMIGGFALAGATMRRRKAIVSFA